MEVSGRYSNPPPTPVDLGKLNWPRSGKPRESTIWGRPHQAQRRLGEPDVDKLVEAYSGGATVLQLATRYQIQRTTVLALLEKKGVPRRGRVWSYDLNKQATRLYTEGISCGSIGRDLRVTPETVRQHLMKAGVALRRSGRPLPRPLPDP